MEIYGIRIIYLADKNVNKTNKISDTGFADLGFIDLAHLAGAPPRIHVKATLSVPAGIWGVVRILFTDIVYSLSSRQMKKIESVLRSIPASRSSIFPHLRIHFNQGNITYIKEARLWKITQSR